MVKKTLLSMAIAAAVVSLAGCNVSTTDKYDNSVDLTPSTAGQPGSTPSVFSPVFSAANSQVPLAIDFLFADAGDSDGTANTADTSPPVTTAINKLDGFSTVAPIYIEFNSEIDADTVVAGKTVFLVKLSNAEDYLGIDALDIDTILAANPANPFSPNPITPADYEARAIDMNGTPAIQVLLKKPLEPKTKYLVVVTNGVKSRGGLNAGMSAEYSLVSGSLELPSSALDPVRGAVKGWQQLASAFLGSGSPLVAQAEGSSVLSYTFTTGGTDDVLKAMAAPGIFMAKQLPTIAHAEGAISKSVIEEALGLGADQATAEAQAGGTLLQIAQGTAMKINAGAGATVIPVDANTRTVLLASAQFAPMYYAGLITTIADGQGAGLDTAVDKPQTRTYQAIVQGPADVVAVSYDAFFTAQIAAQVEKTVEEQITSIAIGEGAITQAVIGGGGNQTMADDQLDLIAGAVATEINANGGSLPTTDGATIRPVLKSTEELQPYYLAGLRKAITDSQTPDAIADNLPGLSSKGSIYQGGLSIPNYLPASEAGKADSELGTWVASAAAATALGLDAAPTDVDGSTNVTYRFPFAEKVSDEVIPVMATLPVDAGACAKANFADGYPVVIYQHGITVDRTAGVLVGNALAQACVAMVAIDHTMHGVAPGNATGLTFSVDKISKGVDLSNPPTSLAGSPFAFFLHNEGVNGVNTALEGLQERHNNVGKNAAQANVAMVFKNEAGATATADVGASGDLYINLNNFARTRDAMRQTVLDLMNLNAFIADMDIDSDGVTGDLDSNKVYFIGHSLGGIIGTTFVAVNNDPEVQAFNGNLPKIQAAILGNAGGGVVKLLENSPSIGGAKILPGLQAAAGLEQGSADIEKFFGVMQAMVDSADPINFVSAPHMQNLPILSYTAVDDLVVPNTAETATVDTAKSYLSGTDPLVKALGITEVVNGSTAQGPVQETRISIRTDAEKSDHSTFSNAKPAGTFAEIYKQIGSFISSGSPLVLQGINVTDNTVLEQVE